MLKRIVLLVVVALSATAVAATSATAARPADPGKGGRCIAAGVGTLVSLGLIDEAARGELDYAPFGQNGLGLIRLPLAAGSYLPLKTVIGLHRTNPELFAWCDSA